MKYLWMVGVLALAGCTTNLGSFTVYGPDGLDLSNGQYAVDRSKKVSAVCHTPIYVVYAPDMPTYDETVRKAMATRPGCVGLADAKLTREAFWLVFGFCDFKAEGYPIVKKAVKKEVK